MIQCRQAADLIPLHVGDDLPAEEAGLLEQHLDGCALCVAEYESYAAARTALLDLREEMPARGTLWAEVARGLDVAPAVEAAPRQRQNFRSRWMAWSSLAVAAALTLIVLPPFLASPDADPAAGQTPTVEGPAPMVRATTPEELQEFLLRTGGMENKSLATPVGGAADEQTPLTTPAGTRQLPHYR